jgi:hypothetical protein
MAVARLGSIAVQVEDYQAPSWPDVGTPKQIHLDLAVDDLDQAEAEAVRPGARRAAEQPAPDRWRVLLDPAGHPFCLPAQIPQLWPTSMWRRSSTVWPKAALGRLRAASHHRAVSSFGFRAATSHQPDR